MKKYISFIISCVLIIGSAVPAFGVDLPVTTNTQATTTALATPPSMDQIVFTGTAISINLDSVINNMLTTGSAIELAGINKRSDYAISKGYAESLTTINLYASASIESKITKLTRDFARDNLETNYQAELNSIEKSAVELFYNTLSAQEYYKVAKEDLAAKELTLSNVQKKYNLGAASKIDLLTAQNAAISSKNDIAVAQTSYFAAKMNFNMKMGYPLMQEIVLVGELKAANVPLVNLDQAIISALEKRNEIKGAEFAGTAQTILFDNMKLTYPSTSSTYIKQEVKYLNAKQTADQIDSSIMIDVMLKYMGLAQKKLAALSAESTVGLAKEAYRISQLTYNAGMSTLAELQTSEVNYSKAKIANISAVTNMALAVYDFEYAQDVGTYRIQL